MRFLAKLALPLVMKPRAVLTTGVELGGFGLVVYGIWQVSETAGFISAGICLLVIGALSA